MSFRSVGHNIFYQWKNDIIKYTNLKCYFYRTKKDKPINVEIFNNYDLVFIVPLNFSPSIIKNYNQLGFKGRYLTINSI